MRRLLFVFTLAVSACGESLTAPPRPVAAGPELNVSSSDPVTVSTASGSLDAGYEHTCALRKDGSVACWGYFPYGQDRIARSAERPLSLSAGFATTCGRRTDGSVVCLGSDGSGQEADVKGPFAEMSAGWYSVCGLRTDQTMLCWGGNDRQQLEFPAGTYNDVSAGRNHNCAVRTDGTVYCTGGFPTAPTPDAGRSYVRVSMGEAHACAIRSDGTIACWGSNSAQQLEGIPTSGTFTQVSAGSAATCALRTDGTILCWGYDGPGGGGLVRPENIPVGPFVRVTVGGYHACAQRSSGAITCWGRGDRGQLNVPADLAQPTTSTASGRLDAGDSHTCVLRRDASVSCWGHAPYGQTNIPPSERPTQISASFGTTCGLRSDGTIACWGTDGSGHLSVPTGAFRQVAAGSYGACGLLLSGEATCWTTGQQDLPDGSYKEVAAGNGTTCGVRTDATIVCTGGPGFQPAPGYYHRVTIGHGSHACAIRTDGTLTCWGSNQYGQLNGIPSGTFTQVSAGGYSTCALREGTGEVACWGYNGPGSDGMTDPPPGQFVRITHGTLFACAQRADDTIVCWGRNDSGQLKVPAEFSNSAPSLSAGGPYAASEGTPAEFNFSASDVNGDALTYTWDLGDGTTGNGPTPPASHTYADDGAYTVTLTATDGKSAAVSATAAVTVANVAPTITAASPESGSAHLLGQAITFSWTVSDPGSKDGSTDVSPGYWIVYVDWGDGSTENFGALWKGTGCPQCALKTYKTPGTYTVNFHVTDNDGAVGSGSLRVIVHQRPVADAGATYNGLEGSTIAFAGGASDPDGDAIVSYAWYFGDGGTAAGQAVTHTYRDNGSYTVTLVVTDARGARSEPSTATVTVANVAPTATLGAPASVNEGSAITLALTNPVDASGDLATLQYAFDCGDGKGYSAFGASNSASCLTVDNGTRTVRGTVRDKDGGRTEYSGSVAVMNVAPTVALDPNQPTSVQKNASFAVTFSFADPGVGDGWFYQVDFGGRCKSIMGNTVAPGTYTVTCSSGYSTPGGPYTVTVRVTDGDGASHSVSFPLTVTK